MPEIHDAREERYGGFLEDYRVGDIYRHWPGKTITEAEDHLFCLLTLAASPIHVDAEYAKREMPGGRNIVVGTYTYSLLLGMSVPDISGRAIASLAVENLTYTALVFHGDTLYGETQILEVRRSETKPDRGVLRVQTVGRNQDGQEVCRFVRALMLPRRNLVGQL